MSDEDIGLVPLSRERPRLSGRGAGRDDWKAYALALEEANFNLQRRLKEYDTYSHYLALQSEQAHRELDQLRSKDRTPKTGRQRLPDETVKRIKAALANGSGVRAVAKMHRVSAMTVSRYKKSMEQTSAD